mmetsp:Transcript_45767/g.143168  ORF Transcript_45767/g.143168 Transcript_45767/m.143168 type:complete len:146 (+) Transcript_45767:930-1367(+)
MCAPGVAETSARLCARHVRNATQAFMAAQELCESARKSGESRFVLHHGKKSVPIADIEASVVRGSARIAIIEDRFPEADALLAKASRLKSGADESLLLYGRFLGNGGDMTEDARERTSKLLRRAQQAARANDLRAQRELSALGLA